MLISSILWTTGIKRLGRLNTSVYGSLQPDFGLAVGMLIRGETLGGLQIAGALIVLSGIMVVNRR